MVDPTEEMQRNYEFLLQTEEVILNKLQHGNYRKLQNSPFCLQVTGIFLFCVVRNQAVRRVRRSGCVRAQGEAAVHRANDEERRVRTNAVKLFLGEQLADFLVFSTDLEWDSSFEKVLC